MKQRVGIRPADRRRDRENDIMDLTIQYYMDDFIRDNDIDTIVLGCTHYPWIQKNIARIYPDLHIINPSSIIVDTIREIIQERDMAAKGSSFENIFMPATFRRISSI